MPVSGNGTAGLRQVMAKLHAIGHGGVRKQLAQSLGAESLALVKRGFQRSEDPYGKPWKQPVMRDGMPLLDTGRLRNAFVVNITESRVEIVNPTLYANVQQFGATILPKNAKALRFRTRGGGFHSLKKAVIPPRQMVPGDTMPPAWATRLSAVADKVFHLFVRAA